ncbi:MFS transporter [Pseudonocardia yuanmonensis]|uniref:MFS transporter n=1 Tax=Pseudonocardia yuanmonensis TaxID=1095914 RepID=UPI0031EAC887
MTIAQGVAGIAVATAAAVGPVAVAAVSGSAALGGASTTSLVLGTAASALVIARIADRAGRRPALMLGYLTGAAGAGLAAIGNATGSWPLMLFAFLAFGAGNAAGLAARFAATDLAAPHRRAHAVGVVMWATTLGAVAGPALAVPAAHGSPWAPAAGVLLLGAVTFGLAALVVGAGLRPDPLLLARKQLPGAGVVAAVRRSPSWRMLWTTPRARVGMIGLALAQLLMVGLMSMTPVHLHHDGASFTLIGLVVSVHMAGMFAMAPAFGWLADRTGPLLVLAAGLLLIAVAGGTATAAAHGTSVPLAGALALLGLGWSAALVAGSSLVTEAAPPEQRPAVQGVVDAIMSLSGAAGGVAAGLILTVTSYAALGGTVAVLTLPVLVLVVAVARNARPHRHRGGST